jgi:hypothetical protein
MKALQGDRVCPSVCLSVRPPARPPACLSVCLSVYLSVSDFSPKLLNTFRLSLVLEVYTKHFPANFILVHIGGILTPI